MGRSDRAGRRSSSARTAVGIAITLAVVAQGLTTPPIIPRAEAQETVGTPQATAPAGEPAQADPLTEADRSSVPVPVDENGIIDPELVDLDPGTGKTVNAIVGDEIPVPTESGADFDAYSPETDVGAHFAVLYPEVVNEQSPDGTWVDVPTDLVPTLDGWELAGESFSVTFPATLDADHRVTYSTPDGSIASIPIGVTSSDGILEADGVRYPEALPGIDAVYTVAPGGFKETLVVNTPQLPSVFTWDVQAEGSAWPRPTTGGSRSPWRGEVVADMALPAITDSSTKPRTTYGAYSLEGSTLILTIDQAWLASAVYPVYVDPGTATPNLTYDTYAKSSSPSGTFGSTTPLVTGPSTGSGTKYRTFMRFGTSWEQSDRVVWNAALHIKNTTEATPGNLSTSTARPGTGPTRSRGAR